MSRNRKRETAKRPGRVVKTQGILTFDSYLCCGHSWASVKNDDPSSKEDFHIFVPPGKKPDYDMVCRKCGAGATFDEIQRGRRVIAYDRDWNFGAAQKAAKIEEQSPIEQEVI